MKCRIYCWFAAAAALVCLATAQSSQVHSSSIKSVPDPGKTATQPLTPKSAMPAQHKASAVAPSVPNNTNHANAELSHLERQNIKASGSKSSNSPSAKVPSVPKSPDAGSGINSTYQKPAGGMKATNPAANSANSPKPRVTKK